MIDFVEKKMAANMAALMSWKKIVQPLVPLIQLLFSLIFLYLRVTINPRCVRYKRIRLEKEVTKTNFYLLSLITNIVQI